MNVSIPVTSSKNSLGYSWSLSNPKKVLDFDTHGSYYYGDFKKSGVSNPRFRDQILAGQNASTNYSTSGYEVRPGFIDFFSQITFSPSDVDFHSFTGTVESGLNCGPWESHTLDAVIRDTAIGRLRNRLGNESQSFNSLVPLGEIYELRELIAGHKSVLSSATGLVNELLKIKRGKLNVRRTVKAAQQAWLAFSFGIKPTLSDISSLGKSIDAYFNKPERNCVITGSAEGSYLNSHRSRDPGAGGSTILSVTQEKCEVGYKFICGHRFYSAATNDYSLLDQLGFNLPNLIPTAWELVPYTWVVDYFTTAGAFLEDTFTAVSGNSIYVVECRRFSCERRARPVAIPNASNTQVFTLGSKEAYGRYHSFSRTSLSSIPARSLRLKSIDEVGRNGVNRLLNLASLLRF